MANHAANTLCPAVAELVRALRSSVPLLAAPSRIGTIRSDGSRHTAGLAIDIMLDSRVPQEKMIADAIIDMLIDRQQMIRWHDILYTDWLPGPPATPFHFHIPGGGGGYGGHVLQKNPNNDLALGRAHEDHVHVDWVDFSMRIPNDRVFVYDWPKDALQTGFAPAVIGAMGRMQFA